MLSVLANIGSLMAEGLELLWSSNKQRIKKIGKMLNLIKSKKSKSNIQLSSDGENDVKDGLELDVDDEGKVIEDDDNEDDEEEEIISASGGILSNIMTFVGTVAILGAFFAGGALLLTFYEDW